MFKEKQLAEIKKALDKPKAKDHYCEAYSDYSPQEDVKEDAEDFPNGIAWYYCHNGEFSQYNVFMIPH